MKSTTVTMPFDDFTLLKEEAEKANDYKKQLYFHKLFIHTLFKDGIDAANATLLSNGLRVGLQGGNFEIIKQ